METKKARITEYSKTNNIDLLIQELIDATPMDVSFLAITDSIKHKNYNIYDLLINKSETFHLHGNHDYIFKELIKNEEFDRADSLLLKSDPEHYYDTDTINLILNSKNYTILSTFLKRNNQYNIFNLLVYSQENVFMSKNLWKYHSPNCN